MAKSVNTESAGKSKTESTKKPVVKKQSGGKDATPKKSAAVSKSTPKKSAAKPKTVKKPAATPKPEPEQKSLFRRKTIAERTVAWKTGAYFKVLRWMVLIPLLLLIVFFTFFMAGYSFTVLVLWCLIGIILFYNITHLLRERYPKAARTVRKMFTTLLLIGLIIVGFTEAVIINASFGSPRESCDYVVVLGAKVRQDGPSVSLMDRIHAAAEYLDEHPEVTAVVSGGKGADEPMTEAQCMYDELVGLGIDPSRIWVEDQATSTWENLHFSLNLIEENTGTRPEKIGILSSEYHLFRASLFADACGVEAVGIPAPTSRLSQKINHFMREVAGVWHYLILGGNYDA